MARTEAPRTVRRLDTDAARHLSRLAAVLDDLQVVARCCDRLLAELGSEERDEVVVEALWTTAVLSYARCFGPDRLSADEPSATDLQGEVQPWHEMLLRIRDHYADPAQNPRENCSVGVAQDEGGRASGIAITATGPGELDEVSVRQTGALAYALAERVERSLGEQQQRVREAANELSAAELNALPRVELAPET